MAGGLYNNLYPTLDEEIGETEIEVAESERMGNAYELMQQERGYQELGMGDRFEEERRMYDEFVQREIGHARELGLLEPAPSLAPVRDWGEWTDPTKVGTIEHISFLTKNGIPAVNSSFEHLGSFKTHYAAQMDHLNNMAKVLAPEFVQNGSWKDTLAAVRNGYTENVKHHNFHQTRLKDALKKLAGSKDLETNKLKKIIEKRIAVNQAKFEKQTWEITRALQKAANPYSYDAEINKWCTENIERCAGREQVLRTEGRSMAQSFYCDHARAPSKFFDEAMAKAEAPVDRPEAGAVQAPAAAFIAAMRVAQPAPQVAQVASVAEAASPASPRPAEPAPQAPRLVAAIRPMPPRPAERVARPAPQAAQVASVADAAPPAFPRPAEPAPQAPQFVAALRPMPPRPAVAPEQPRSVPAHVRRMQNSLQGFESLAAKRAEQLASNIQGAVAVRDRVGAIVQRSNATMDPVAPLRDSAGDRIKFTSDQTSTMHVLEIASGVLQKEMAKESSAYPHIDKLASSIETTASGFYSGNSRGGPDQASLDAFHVVADAAAWGLSPEQNQGQHGQPAFFERPEYVDTQHLQPGADNNEVWADFAKETADDARRAARMGPAAFKAEGPVNADLKFARAEFAALRAPHDASEAKVYEAVHEALRSLEAPDQAKPKDGAPPKPSISLGHIGEVMRSYVRESHAGDLQTRALAAVSRVAEWCTNHTSRAVPETSMGNADRPGPSLDRAGAARGMAELAQEAQAMRQSYQPEGKKVSKAQARAYDMQDRGLAGAKEIGAAAKSERATLAKLDAWEAASKAKAARTGDFTDDGRRSVEAWKVKKPDAEEQGKGRSR